MDQITEQNVIVFVVVICVFLFCSMAILSTYSDIQKSLNSTTYKTIKVDSKTMTVDGVYVSFDEGSQTVSVPKQFYDQIKVGKIYELTYKGLDVVDVKEVN